MKKDIKVGKTTESVTILEATAEGTFLVVWHRTGGLDEEFHVTPSLGDSVEDAIAKDLRRRLGP